MHHSLHHHAIMKCICDFYHLNEIIVNYTLVNANRVISHTEYHTISENYVTEVIFEHSPCERGRPNQCIAADKTPITVFPLLHHPTPASSCRWAVSVTYPNKDELKLKVMLKSVRFAASFLIYYTNSASLHDRSCKCMVADTGRDQWVSSRSTAAPLACANGTARRGVQPVQSPSR